jgi:hypothetical protein
VQSLGEHLQRSVGVGQGVRGEGSLQSAGGERRAFSTHGGDGLVAMFLSVPRASGDGVVPAQHGGSEVRAGARTSRVTRTSRQVTGQAPAEPGTEQVGWLGRRGSTGPAGAGNLRSRPREP